MLSILNLTSLSIPILEVQSKIDMVEVEYFLPDLLELDSLFILILNLKLHILPLRLRLRNRHK